MASQVRVNRYERRLMNRIDSKRAQLGVIGLGYVGLPLAVEFAKVGLRVTGFDIDRRRVDQVNRGRSYIQDVPTRELRPLVRSGLLRATHQFEALRRMDVIDICVPTPLRKTRDPDMSYIVASVESIAPRFTPGKLVILESTTYPGTTEELVKPMLEARGLRAGSDFFLAFSPERVDPGNPVYTTKTIPKVVGGITPACTRIATRFYSGVIERVVPVGSSQVAETVKLLENTFRSVNIGLVNEMALMCDKMGIDVWEVIRAASTKPFGFMPFYPGPGLGGHCIPIDPFYLSWKARQSGFEARFIELAGQVNGSMPEYVVRRVGEALNSARKPIRRARILVLGVAYKADIDDVRESPSLDIIETLERAGGIVEYSDPFVAKIRHRGRTIRSRPFSPTTLKRADCVVIATAHRAFDYAAIARHSRLIVDTRNALGSRRRRGVFRL